MTDVTKLVTTLADTWETDHVNLPMNRLHLQAQRLIRPFIDYEVSALKAGFVLNAAGRWEDPKVGEDGVTCPIELWEMEGYEEVIRAPAPTSFEAISSFQLGILTRLGHRDFETPARAAGWEIRPDHTNWRDYPGEHSIMHQDQSLNDSSYGDWQTCCEENDIEPIQLPLRIDRDFAGLIVWAKPTS